MGRKAFTFKPICMLDEHPAFQLTHTEVLVLSVSEEAACVLSDPHFRQSL
jgi:hypothetical protein